MRTTRLLPLPTLLLLATACAPAAHPTAVAPAKPGPITGEEVLHHDVVLAADDMEGRGIGTKGIDKAADYIRDQFRADGLASAVADGSYFQPFEMTVGVSVGSGNTMTLKAGPHSLDYVEDKDWRPLQFSASGTVEAPVVFAGWGITAPEEKWDDYAGLDAKGKIVLVLRHEPWEKTEKELTRYSELRVKAINAHVHGAVGLLLVNDVANHEGDPDAAKLLKIEPDADASFEGIYAAHVTPDVADDLFAGAGLSVAKAEKLVADKAASRPLEGVAVKLNVSLNRTRKPVKNVIAVLPGSDPALSKEVVVIGAHYDHLGYGGRDALDPDAGHVIHHGADDNGSGTSALLGIARAMGSAPEKPKRTVVFIAFTAEEAGLGGSSWYVNHPLWPLDATVAMLNMDMVGRMHDKKLVAFGADTSPEFAKLVDDENADKLDISAHGDGYGPSDQTAFYAKNIPVLFFFTGAHVDYHRATDTSDKIDGEGLASVARLVQRIATSLADQPARPGFVASSAIPHAEGQTGATGGYGAYFGSIPDFTESELPGVLISGTRAGSPAEKAGLVQGDRIVKFGEVTITNLYDLAFALKKYKPGDEIEVSWVHGKDTKTAKAVLSTRGD